MMAAKGFLPEVFSLWVENLELRVQQHLSEPVNNSFVFLAKEKERNAFVLQLCVCIRVIYIVTEKGV